MKTKKEILTLCAICHSQFEYSPARRIYRTRKKTREVCTYCNSRMGYDYKIVYKKGDI